MAMETSIGIVLFFALGFFIYFKFFKEKEGFNLLGNANKFHKEHSRCMRDCSLADKRKGSTYFKWNCSKYCDIVLDTAVKEGVYPHQKPTPHELCNTIYDTNNQIANCECMEDVNSWCQQECRYSSDKNCETKCIATKETNCKGGNNWVRLEE